MIAIYLVNLLYIHFFRPPKFDFEQALERKKIKEKHKMLKRRKQLEAFVKPSLQAAVTVTENVESETTTESIEEFQDGVYQTKITDDYSDDDYEDVSGDMTDDDYL